MSSNNYNPYDYQAYSQSSSSQYSGYQTAPAPKPASQQSARQHYQQAQPTGTSQATAYAPYAAHAHHDQGSTYGTSQDGTWGRNAYGANRETTRGAAEVLRNMSNSAYSSHGTVAVSQPGFTATNAALVDAARYSNASPSQQLSQPPQQQGHSQYPSYGQSQTRPRSVNTNRVQTTPKDRALPSPALSAVYSAQRTQVMHNQPQQRSASPAQVQYGHGSASAASTSRNVPMTAGTQYHDFNNNNNHTREVTSIDNSSMAQNNSLSAGYNYSSTQDATPLPQTTSSSNVPEAYSQATVTVDPMAVYDPWPEYNRKQEAIRAQRAAEESERAEREAAEARKEEVRRQAEQEKAKETNASKQKKPSVANVRNPQTTVLQNEVPESTTETQDAIDDGSSNLESQIRQMMAKMRELNSKDPALLARIWEEERRTKAPKSPTVRKEPTPQAVPVQRVPTPAPQAANTRKKAAPKETSHVAATSTKPPIQPPAPIQVPIAKPQVPATPVNSNRSAGSTLWPPEKKNQLAEAMVAYLTPLNPPPHIPVTTSQILAILNDNPSYIELCEHLEALSLKLDRAAFAKRLLSAVPDVNSTAKSQGQARSSVLSQQPARSQPPNAVRTVQRSTKTTQKQEVVTPGAPLFNVFVPPDAAQRGEDAIPVVVAPVPVAEMIPIKSELKPPANKEEAARKRSFNELIDLTSVDDDDQDPPMKKPNLGTMYQHASPGPKLEPDSVAPNNFPVAASVPTPTYQAALASPVPPPEALRTANIARPLNKNQALRRNTYNISTIARDVLLACGRHPEERQLNAHLEILKSSLHVSNDADLSSLRWDLIDPGQPPRGYYRDRSVPLNDDADDEDDSEDDRPPDRSRALAHPGPGSISATTDVKVQAQPGTNPFKTNKRGRPPRPSYPGSSEQVASPKNTPRATVSTTPSLNKGSPHPSSASVGYSAFRAATETIGPDGKPIRKRGRPVGWRKSIHGTPAANAHPSPNRFTGPRPQASQPAHSQAVGPGGRKEEPMMIDSRSPSVAKKATRYQSFKCKWHNCSADLHNLETLRKHVQKLHQKETPRGVLECHWDRCGREVTNANPVTGMTIERQAPFSFSDAYKWREHLEIRHFGPLSWELGDGPASGLSDAHDSEAYLSDAQGRRVTPRITVDPTPAGVNHFNLTNSAPTPRGRGRPPKISPGQEARDAQDRMVAHKKRVGGPGMDRGGASLANEKRRKGFSDDDATEEEFVDAER